ncbi:MAG: RNA methyltransferase [Candidatus Tumulicola sp.]
MKTAKGRRARRRFTFEGPTLLAEALRSGARIEELYVTQAAYDASVTLRDLDAAGIPTFVLDERTAAGISEVETPSGILAVSPVRLRSSREVMSGEGIVLVLADLNDPGNAGALLRSAEAFGARGVLFGLRGVEPYHPKLVRAAMGSHFRLDLGLSDPDDLKAAATAGGFSVVGLTIGGTPLDEMAWPTACALVVGHERHGLGAWAYACDRKAEISMAGPSESLNAAIAGSIALYEGSRSGRRVGSEPSCQESV